MQACVRENERVSMQILIKGDNGEVFTETMGSFSWAWAYFEEI